MSLSAKQRILKLRETEFKLQKLQNDLTQGETGSVSVHDFLAHHKELMALPGSTRNSIQYRGGSQVQKRYYNVHDSNQRLTLPPKLDSKSINRIKPFKDTGDDLNPVGVGLNRHPSLALQTLYNQLDKQTSKMSTYSKSDRFSYNTPLRGKQALNSNRYITPKPSGSAFKPTPHRITKYAYFQSQLNNKNSSSFTPSIESKAKLGVSQNLSQVESFAPPLLTIDEEAKTNSELSLNQSYEPSDTNLSYSNDLRNTISFALTASNLMGVFLPPTPSPRKRGPSSWNDKTSPTLDDEEMTAKDALNLLKRRNLPPRKSYTPEHVPPHRRGLIGVEISGFEPECSFFYRDRNGNFNPHLHHSKEVIETLNNQPASKLLKQR